MQEINRTYENNIAANAAGTYRIFTLDLSALTEKHLMLSVDTVAFDPLNGDTSNRHTVTGLYNDTSATVTTPSTYFSENKDFNQGDSDVQQIAYAQGTSILTQDLNVTTTGSRTIKVISYVKILAF